MDVVGAAHVGLVLLSAALWRANWFSRLGPEMAKGQWGVARRNGNLMFRRMLCVGLWMGSMWQTEQLLQVALFSVSVSLCALSCPHPMPFYLSSSLIHFSPFILPIVHPAKFPWHSENMLVASFFPLVLEWCQFEIVIRCTKQEWINTLNCDDSLYSETNTQGWTGLRGCLMWASIIWNILIIHEVWSCGMTGGLWLNPPLELVMQSASQKPGLHVLSPSLHPPSLCYLLWQLFLSY